MTHTIQGIDTGIMGRVSSLKVGEVRAILISFIHLPNPLKASHEPPHCSRCLEDREEWEQVNKQTCNTYNSVKEDQRGDEELREMLAYISSPTYMNLNPLNFPKLV